MAAAMPMIPPELLSRETLETLGLFFTGIRGRDTLTPDALVLLDFMIERDRVPTGTAVGWEDNRYPPNGGHLANSRAYRWYNSRLTSWGPYSAWRLLCLLADYLPAFPGSALP